MMDGAETATSDLPPGVIVVANPYSGAKQNLECVEALAFALRQRRLECRIVWQLSELVEIAADSSAGERYRAVIAAGGDGTLNRVINLQNSLPVFMFPLGNENLFSRQFGCCCDPRHAAEAVFAGQSQSIDLGRAGERLFAIVASAGFDGDATHRLAQWRQRADRLRRVRSLSYAAPILAAAWRYGYPPIEVNADGQKVRGAMCMVFNLPRYANDLRLAPEADPHDGLLDWLVFERPGSLSLMRYAWSVWRERHRQRGDVHHGRAKRITLAASQAVPLEVDGEAADFAPVTIEVVPNGVRVIVPPEACGCIGG